MPLKAIKFESPLLVRVLLFSICNVHDQFLMALRSALCALLVLSGSNQALGGKWIWFFGFFVVFEAFLVTESKVGLATLVSNPWSLMEKEEPYDVTKLSKGKRASILFAHIWNIINFTLGNRMHISFCTS